MGGDSSSKHKSHYVKRGAADKLDSPNKHKSEYVKREKAGTWAPDVQPIHNASFQDNIENL